MHIFANAGIQRAEGLIEQQHPRLHHERLGDGQPLLHPPGQLRRVFIQSVPQPHFRQHVLGLLPGLAFSAAKQAPQQRGRRQLQADGDVIQHVEMRKHRIALEDHAAAAIRLRRQRLAIEQDLATGRFFLTEQQA